MAAEMGCLVLVSLFAIPITTDIVWYFFFPNFNIVQATAVGTFIWIVIYKILETIFGKGQFE